MGLGYVEGITHDYVRHGTTTLFAALDIATGAVFTECKSRHRHQEFLSFLRHLDASVPPELDLHLIVDNYATHKHPNVRTWLAQRPRYHMHYTPTYSSWLNQVERWFGLFTQRPIRRGSFTSVQDLSAENRRLRPALQSFQSASRLDGYRRFHPAEDRPTLFAYFRDTTLAGCPGDFVSTDASLWV
jgi:transposase